MNVPQLRTLVAIADQTSFADAAERLFLTPAAVSQQMRALEDELQVALFDRTKRPPRLNAHGAHVAERAREVLRGFDALLDEARAGDEIAGRLTLGCISGISSDLIPIACAPAIPGCRSGSRSASPRPSSARCAGARSMRRSSPSR